ncbi:MAG: bifunctional diaminohydroxyphosphoribosylaminopyrimidine deaminase/5-amino-6-(5-phosphoribosylamino)uracil reductase RibD [Gammaproteobacteria bacterium]|nr:bifunctional diaminohydroxyphosphoribosylaminopyrimidine deaminase/5-amino-6-(5-phosphoribosylamino)uracil reductase RibD [Gammaproteobacteria bacterium]
MQAAIGLAFRGLYTTRPNPRVGCVITREGRQLASGWHAWAGQGHAEVKALEAAHGDVRGATAYVTLEPCSHHGRTPPCADALIEAGIARVVVANTDPNPLVAGQGLARLQAAGIEVRRDLLAEQAAELNPGFFKRMRSGLPLVRVKLAASLDGRTALRNGQSQWITGKAARRDVQHWRARSCAILTGIDTVLDDDPRLTVRVDELEPCDGPRGDVDDLQQPLRVVLDSQLRIDINRQLLTAPGRTLLLTGRPPEDPRRQSLQDALHRLDMDGVRVEIEQCALDAGGRLDLRAVLTLLGRRQINEVHVEAGARLSGAWLAAGLVDELLLYQAPCLLGDDARPLMHLPALQDMQHRHRLRLVSVVRVGEDLRLLARP